MGLVYNNFDDVIADPITFKQLAVKDALLLHYMCPQVDKQLQLFSHYNEIMFTLDGGRILSHGDKSWMLHKHSCILTRKTAYLQELPESMEWKVLAFYFKDNFVREVIEEYRQYLSLSNLPEPDAEMLMEIHTNETTQAFFYSILPYFSQTVPAPEGLLELKFKELLFNIFLDPENKSVLAYANSLMHISYPPIWQVMEKNFMFNLTVEQFARMSNRSVSVFKKDFFQHYQTTPGRWLTQKRLELAKSFLESDKKSVSEVAFSSGFENLSHFSRVFKEKYGVSPVKYKRA